MSLQKLVKVFALAAAVVFSTGTARTAEPIVLKLSHFVPPQHAFHKWVVGLDPEDRAGDRAAG